MKCNFDIMKTSCSLLVALASVAIPVWSKNVHGPTPAQEAAQQQDGMLIKDGNKHLQAGEFSQAEGDFRLNIQLGFQNPSAYKGLAEAYIGQGETAPALETYRKLYTDEHFAHSTTLSDVTVLMNYAILLDQAGEWKDAVWAYEKGLSNITVTDSGNLPKIDAHFTADTPQPAALEAGARIALGLQYSFYGNPDNSKALDEYDKALSLEPDWAIANFYHADGLKRLGRTAEAKAAFAKTMEISQGSVKEAAESNLK